MAESATCTVDGQTKQLSAGCLSNGVPAGASRRTVIGTVRQFYEMIQLPRNNVGWDSSVGMATGYGVDGPGIESRTYCTQLFV